MTATAVPQDVAVATIGRRVAANLLDGLVLSWPLVIVFAAIAAQSLEVVLVAWALWVVNSFVLGIVNWGLTARRGYTIGQLRLGVWVLDEGTSTPIGWGRAFVRNLVLSLLSVTGVGLVLNGLAMAGDARCRGWHDRAVGAVVLGRGATPGRSSPAAPRPAYVESRAPLAQPTPPTHSSPLPAPLSLATPQPATAGAAPLVARSPLPGVVPAVTELRHDPASRPPLITAPPGGVTAPPPAAAPVVGAMVVPVSTPGPAPVPAPVSIPVDRPELRLVTASGRPLPRADQLVVGRDPVTAEGQLPCVLDDPNRSLSKTHAVFRRDGDRLWVADLDSTNGVAVVRDDSPILVEPDRPQELRDRDRVLLGEFEIRVKER